MQSPKDFSNLFLDMNAFFASVEQQVQPILRGKPIGIAPYTGDTGCVIAKSYEAKSFGIKTGTLVGEAKKLCPQIIILESRPELYLFYHRQIVAVLQTFSPFLRVLSIDEFNIKLTGLDRSRKAAQKMAQNIKKAIREKIGDYLSCSVGIGPNMWLAKIAGELGKTRLPAGRPDGLVILTLKELPALYRSLDLIDLPGINIGMTRQFRRKKISTPFDFYGVSLFNLSRWFGHPGRVWFYRLRGYETDDIKVTTKSIGHQHVLAPEYRSKEACRRVLVKLTEKCGRKLRRKNLFAGGVVVMIKFLDGRYWSKKTVVNLISDSQSIQMAALRLYDSCRIPAQPLKIVVTFFNLQKFKGSQISLLPEIEKSRQISLVIDQINDRYGENTVYPASMCGTSEAAPNRIAFGEPATL